MLQPLGLTYKLEDDVILITSPQATQAQTITKTYYVGDLIMPPDRAPQNLMPNRIFDREQNPSNDPNAGFGPNPGVFGPADPRYPAGFNTAGSATGERPKIDMTPIIQLITMSIAPGTWKVQDGYGQDASAGLRPGRRLRRRCRRHRSAAAAGCDRAVLPQHQLDHQAHGRSSRPGRRPAPPASPAQDLQVSIEVRFITVNDTFFEYIGVDFDFEIQSDSVGKHSTFAIPNPAVSLFAGYDEHKHVDQHELVDER